MTLTKSFLSKGALVWGCRYAGTIKCTGFQKSGDEVAEVQAEFHPLVAGEKPPKGVLSWVGQPAPGQDPPAFEARLYDVLFRTASVAETGDDWLSDLNPGSLTVVSGALGTPRLAAAPVGSRCVLISSTLTNTAYILISDDAKPDCVKGSRLLAVFCTVKGHSAQLSFCMLSYVILHVGKMFCLVIC